MKKLLLILLLTFSINFNAISSEEINLYTARHYKSDKELYKKFEKQYGIKINYISSKGKVLVERIKSEGKDSPADILFVVDAGNLWKVQKLGLFQRIKSEKINKVLPENLIGRDNKWVAITKRARVIFYNPDITYKKDIESLDYEDLSAKYWKNKIVIRSSNNIYNQSLVASLIHHNGESYTKAWMNIFENKEKAKKYFPNISVEIVVITLKRGIRPTRFSMKTQNCRRQGQSRPCIVSGSVYASPPSLIDSRFSLRTETLLA